MADDNARRDREARTGTFDDRRPSSGRNVRDHRRDGDVREYGGAWEDRAGYYPDRPADYPDMRFGENGGRTRREPPEPGLAIGPGASEAARERSSYEQIHDRGNFGGAGTGSFAAPGAGPDHRGKGPKGYVRSDQRIEEDVCERLADDPDLDASAISVTVENGEVTLAGLVDDRRAKRRAEDCTEAAYGVRHVQNNLRVRPSGPSS